MKQKLMAFGQALLDVIYPPHCLICRRGGQYLCDQCAASLSRAEPPRCDRCWLPGHVDSASCPLWGTELEFIRAPYLHEGPARDLVHALKYDGISVLAKPMGLAVAAFVRENEIAADLVVPVPLHARRQRSRGFNQSEKLAGELAAALHMEFQPLLRRTRHTLSQVQQRTAAERVKNVDGAFTVLGDVKGRTVLLIDDVATTGATMAECARTLQEAGAAGILGLTFTREQ